MGIPEKLKEYMDDHDMRQKELAADLGLPLSTLNGYLTGRRQIPHETLRLIAEKLGITMDYLYGLTDDSRRPFRLSKAERSLIQDFRQLSRDQKELIAQNIRFMQQQNRDRWG